MFSLYLQLFLAFGLATSLGLAASYCLTLPISNTSGYLLHSTTFKKQEVHKCEWKFNNSPQASSGCRMVIFEVLETAFFDLKSKFIFKLPDEPDEEYSCSKSGWCRKYVKSGSDVTHCKRLLNETNLCNDGTKTSLMWPPVITTRFYKSSAVMSYQFVNCHCSLETSTDQTTTPGSAQCSRPKDFKESSASSYSSILLGLVVVLSIVLSIAGTGLLFMVFKSRRLEEPLKSSNDVYSMADTLPTISNGGKTDGIKVIYESTDPSTDKKIVYNDLYQL